MVAPGLGVTGLSSLWDGLSPHLIASIYEVVKIGDEWGRNANGDPATVPVSGYTSLAAFKPPGIPDGCVANPRHSGAMAAVCALPSGRRTAFGAYADLCNQTLAPLTEASMEMVLNWQSPFEQAGPESKAPALMAMLQSGALAPIVDVLLPGNPKANSNGSAQQKSNGFLRQFEGRTGITRLNSTQVFNGMPPVKIQVVALLRAWREPASEVEAPLDKLMEWALPIELSNDGSLLARAAQTIKGDMDYVQALMPSKAPTRVALKFKGRTWCPLVIESIGIPMNSPIDANGQYVELAVPMTLCTLTALDRKDWSNTSKVSLI